MEEGPSLALMIERCKKIFGRLRVYVPMYTCSPFPRRLTYQFRRASRSCTKAAARAARVYNSVDFVCGISFLPYSYHFRALGTESRAAATTLADAVSLGGK